MASSVFLWPGNLTFSGNVTFSGSATVNGTLAANSVVLDATNQDVILVRDAANVLAQRNSTTAQLLRVYNTFTDASNYERLDIGPNAGGIGANVFGVVMTAAGTGTATRALQFKTAGGQITVSDGNGQMIFNSTGIDFNVGGSGAWRINRSTGGLLAQTDNTYDIGATGATRPKNLYLAGLLTLSGGTLLATSTALTNGAAAQAGSLTNAPTAGNPTKWIPINDNGTTRYIPAW